MTQQSRWSDVKVGAFVLAAMLILIVGSLWILGSTFLTGDRRAYVVLMQQSAGLDVGDRVRFAGVAVGKVRRVQLQPDLDWPVRLVVSLRSGIPIRTDSSAHVSTAGLMGSSFLVIEPGSPGASLLEPGGVIHGRVQPGFDEALIQVTTLLTQTSELVQKVSDEVGPILNQIESLVSGDNVERVGDILETLDRTAEDAAPRISALLTQLEAIAASVERGVDDVPQLTERMARLVDDVHTALGPDGSRLATLLESARASLDTAQGTLSLVDRNKREVEWILRDLRDSVANLKAFSQQVKERPFSLVRIKPEPARQPGDGVEQHR